MRGGFFQVQQGTERFRYTRAKRKLGESHGAVIGEMGNRTVGGSEIESDGHLRLNRCLAGGQRTRDAAPTQFTIDAAWQYDLARGLTGAHLQLRADLALWVRDHT